MAEKNPYTYRGYYRDNETGFYYLQSRYYDAEIERFLNADTTDVLHNSSGISDKNIFTYCKNNSVNNIDKNGMYSISTSNIATILDGVFWLMAAALAVSYNTVGTALKLLCKKILKKGYNKVKVYSQIKGVLTKFMKRLDKIVKTIRKMWNQYKKIVPKTVRGAIGNVISWLTGNLYTVNVNLKMLKKWKIKMYSLFHSNSLLEVPGVNVFPSAGMTAP